MTAMARKSTVRKRAATKKSIPSSSEAPSAEQIERAYAALPELQEPGKAERRAAFIVVLVLVVAVGMAGAAIELFLKPVLVTPANAASAQVRDVYMRVTPSGYEPSVFTVRTGEAIRWHIDTTNASGCGSTLLAPDIGISRTLEPGVTVIAFTADAPGKVPFSCASTELQGYFAVE